MAQKKSQKDKPVNELSKVFAKKKDKLTYQLDRIEACNKLLSAENPFSIEILNKEFFGELYGDFQKLLSSKILGEQWEITDTFTSEEIVALKALAKRVGEQSVAQSQSTSTSATSKKNKSKKVREKLKLNLDFTDGDTLVIKNNTVFDGVDGKSFLKSGDQVMFLEVSKKDDNKILVINEDGEEGFVILNSVDKIT